MVATCWWPSSSCTVRMSWSVSSRRVANEWRSVCALTGLAVPAVRQAALNVRDDGVVEMMPPFGAVARITRTLLREEHVLPADLVGSIRVSARKRMRQPHCTEASGQVGVVQQAARSISPRNGSTGDRGSMRCVANLCLDPSAHRFFSSRRHSCLYLVRLALRRCFLLCRGHRISSRRTPHRRA